MAKPHPFLTALPKCEHHMHLEGALSPALLFALAAKNNIPLPSASSPAYASPATLATRYLEYTSLQDFLDLYYFGISVLHESADFEFLAWEYFQRAASDGVHHVEVSFDPQAHTTRGIRLATVVEGFSRACQRAEVELGISTVMIMCFLRHLPASEAATTLEAARPFFASGVLTGVGLDSSELGFPPTLFTDVYTEAGEMGCRRTAHAGEEGDASYIRDALNILGVQRIDHGIRLSEDEQLMAEVAARGVMLTICPLSNVRLKVVSSVDQLPIRKFLDAGVKFSINSDDPGYFGGYVLDNYVAVQEAFRLTVDDWAGVEKASIEGSWCGEARKTELLTLLDRVVKKFTGTSVEEL